MREAADDKSIVHFQEHDNLYLPGQEKGQESFNWKLAPSACDATQAAKRISPFRSNMLLPSSG
jgi:hypothetical protein